MCPFNRECHIHQAHFKVLWCRQALPKLVAIAAKLSEYCKCNIAGFTASFEFRSVNHQQIPPWGAVRLIVVGIPVEMCHVFFLHL